MTRPPPAVPACCSHPLPIIPVHCTCPLCPLTIMSKYCSFSHAFAVLVHRKAQKFCDDLHSTIRPDAIVNLEEYISTTWKVCIRGWTAGVLAYKLFVLVFVFLDDDQCHSAFRISFVPVLPQLKEYRNTPGIPLDCHSGRLVSATDGHTVSLHYQ